MKEHLLPFDDHDTGKLADLGLLDHEIEYMTQNVTLELPANRFRRRLEPGRPRGRRIDSLEYVSFQLRHTFPHNIALMNTGEIVYCTEFDTRSSDGQVIIRGHKFNMVSSKYFIFYQNIRFRSLYLNFVVNLISKFKSYSHIIQFVLLVLLKINANC